MNPTIILLMLLNYSAQAAIYYRFFYHAFASEQPYAHGLISFIIFSDLIMAADRLLSFSMHTVWIKSVFNGILIIIALRLIFRASWRHIIFQVFLPFLLLVSFGELFSVAAAQYLIGIDVTATLEVEPAATAVIYILSDAIEACLLALASRFYGSSSTAPLAPRLQFTLLAAMLFQIMALTAVSYCNLYSSVSRTLPELVLIILFTASNLGTIYLLYMIHRNRVLHEHAMVLGIRESVMDSQMRFLQQENVKAMELQQEITAAMSDLDANEASMAQLAADYHAYRSQVYSDSPVLDTLLKSYAARFQEMSIRFSFQIQCAMANTMDPLDLVGIFSNLLDNAMEAVQANPPDHREIRLNVRRAANVLSIEIDNSLPERHAAVSKRVQGEGIKIMQGILQHYHGSMESAIQNGLWHTEAICQTGSAPGSSAGSSMHA